MKIKLCPFCNTKPDLSGECCSHFVVCPKCRATGPRSEDRLMSIELWNSRGKQKKKKYKSISDYTKEYTARKKRELKFNENREWS